MPVNAKTLTAVGGSLLAVSTFAGPAMMAPAFATSVCATGAVELSDFRCEVTETGSGTFTAPAGATALEALLVGGGGAGTGGYGGGGGDVQIVKLATTGDVTFSVADAGTFDNSGTGIGGDTLVSQGSTTGLAAGGGVSPGIDLGGTSGSGNVSTYRGGSGAGSASTTNDGGAGIVVSTLTSTLFTDDDTCLGGGGAAFAFSTPWAVATCGGGWSEDYVPNTSFTPNTGSVTTHAPVANSGGGGNMIVTFSSATNYDWASQDGAAGTVVFRYKMPEPVLANTGAPALNAWTLAGAALAATAGAGMLVTARRRTRSL